MIIIPPYEKFKKSDIHLDAIGNPIILFPEYLSERLSFNYSEEQIKEKFVLAHAQAFELGYLNIAISFYGLRILATDIRTWNVVMVKKWHRLIIAIYDLLEVDYVEL